MGAAHPTTAGLDGVVNRPGTAVGVMNLEEANWSTRP